MAIEVPKETGEFLAQRNLLLIACISALLILSPDFKGLDLNLAIVHLKVDNAVYVRGFIFLSVLYLTVRYTQAAKNDDRYNTLRYDISELFKAQLRQFGVIYKVLHDPQNTYDIYPWVEYVILVREYERHEKVPRMSYRKMYKKETRRDEVEVKGLAAVPIVCALWLTRLLTVVLSPFSVVNVLEFVFPYFLAILVCLELSNIHIFGAIVTWAGGLFPNPSFVADLPQTESCLAASGALDLLKAYRHALLGFENMPALIEIESK